MHVQRTRLQLLCSLVLSSAWSGVQAQPGPTEQAATPVYPQHPIRLVVPMPAAGGTDVWARLVAERMSHLLGQKIIVDNRPGAGTIIGAEIVARAPADGYTLLIGDIGTYALNPHLHRKLPYDPVRDFTPITLTSRHLLVLAVPRTSTAASLQELIQLARDRPGALNYGSAGAGSPHHLAMELLQQTAGIQLRHIPYKGGAPLAADMLAGQLDVAFMDMPSALPHLKSGWLRGLALVAPARRPALPDLPTLHELGYAGFDAQAWQGLVAPAGTPAEIVARLNAVYAQVCREPAVQRRLEQIGIELTPGSPQEFSAWMQAETDKWGRLIREKGLLLD